MRDDHDVTSHDGLAPAERLLSRAADGATARGRPLSRRARQTQRSVEAYLKAGVRPRWMERVEEIDQGIATEKQRLARAYRALGEECGGDAGRLRGALERARALVALRPPQRAHRAAQRLVSDRAPAPDGPTHGRLRALRGALLPPSGARRALDPRALPGQLDVSGARPLGQVAPGEGQCLPPTPTAGARGPLRMRRSSRAAPHHSAGMDRRGRRGDRRAPWPGQRPGGAARRPRRQGRQAAKAQALATRTLRLPPGHRHGGRPARSPRPLPGRPAPPGRRRAGRPRPARPGAQGAPGGDPAEQREGAHAVGRARHHRHHLPAPSPPDTSLDDESSVAQRYAQQTLGGPRAAVVGVTGAVPARQAQFHEIEQALPLIQAASVVLIALDRGPRLPLDRRPPGGAGGRGDRLHDCHARAAVAGERATSRCPRRSSRWWSSSCSGWSPTTRSSSCPRRASACARATSASRGARARSPRSRRSSSPPA